MKLTKYQKKSLGFDQNEIPRYIWNEDMGKIYLKLDDRNIELDEQGQTYSQFLQMQKQQPNEQGTGRYKFQAIQQIQFIFIPKESSNNKKGQNGVKNKIQKLMQTYLRIPAKFNSKIKLALRGINLIDSKMQVQYQIKQQQQRLNVYDILDVLMEYRDQRTILVGLIESGLQQDGDILDGRACGDGVAVISYQPKGLQGNFEPLLQTILHETLHTLGFDHCIAWQCLMNGLTNDESWLCPACSRKLYHQLNLATQKDVEKWIKQAILAFQELKCQKTAKKGKKILKTFLL